MGILLMVRGGVGGIYYGDRFRGKKKSLPMQWGRFLYLFVGIFLVVVEVAYFFFDTDWFHMS